MTKFKSRIAAVMLALVLAVASLGLFTQSGTQRANASPIGYGGEDIYYLTDYYPSVKPSTIESQTNLTVYLDTCYDLSWQLQFYDEYLLTFNGVCLIVDIKTFLPNSYELYELFYMLKEYNECYIIFNTTYDETDFDDTSFLDYVDESRFNDPNTRLVNFIETSLANFFDYTDDFTTACFFINGFFYVDEYYMPDFVDLCEISFFFRTFVDVLANLLNINDYSSYEELQDILIGEEDNSEPLPGHGGESIGHPAPYNVQIFIGYDYTSSGYNFYNVLTGYSYQLYRYEDFDFLLGELSNDRDIEYEFDDMCGVCKWEPAQSYYNAMYNAQDGHYFPIYAFVVDPIDYSEDGLIIIPDGEFGSVDDEELLGIITSILSME